MLFRKKKPGSSAAIAQVPTPSATFPKPCCCRSQRWPCWGRKPWFLGRNSWVVESFTWVVQRYPLVMCYIAAEIAIYRADKNRSFSDGGSFHSYVNLPEDSLQSHHGKIPRSPWRSPLRFLLLACWKIIPGSFDDTRWFVNIMNIYGGIHGCVWK